MAEPLTIRRIGWAGYKIAREGETRVVIGPYLHGSESDISGLPKSPYTVRVGDLEAWWNVVDWQRDGERWVGNQSG